MVTVTLEQVQRAAALSKIALNDQQAMALQKELDKILEHVKQLSAVNTVGVEPTYQVTGLSNIMRSDELIDYKVSQLDLLRNVPAHQDGSLKVPKIL